MESKEQFLEPYREKGYDVYSFYSFDNIKPFLAQHVKMPRFIVAIIIISLIVGSGILGAAAGYSWKMKESIVKWGILFAQTLLCSFIGITCMIPLHEFIHWIAFKCIGARNIRFGADWKHFVFYAAVHDYALNYKQFRAVAVAPLYTILLILGITVLTPVAGWIKLVCLVLYLFHLLSCSGDIMLLTYFRKLKHRDILTVDDIENKTTYFLEKVRV